MTVDELRHIQNRGLGQATDLGFKPEKSSFTQPAQPDTAPGKDGREPEKQNESDLSEFSGFLADSVWKSFRVGYISGTQNSVRFLRAAREFALADKLEKMCIELYGEAKYKETVDNYAPSSTPAPGGQ